MKTTKVTLTKVFRGESGEVKTKFGDRTKVGIKVQEESVMLEDGRTANVSDKYLTALFKPNTTSGTEDWEAGKQVEVSISEREGYFNFKVVGFELEDRLKRLEDAVFGNKEVEKKGIDAFDAPAPVVRGNVVTTPSNDINPDEINF